MILTHTKDFFEKMALIHQISTNFVVEKMSFESFKISGNKIINVKGHQRNYGNMRAMWLKLAYYSFWTMNTEGTMGYII